MAKQRPMRAGDRWQPAMAGRPRPGRRSRFAVRAPRRLDGVLLPRWPLLRAVAVRVPWRRVALAALFLTALTAGGWWVYQSPLLSIEEVSVKGTVALSAEQLREAADLEGQSMVRPDFAAARERLRALPMVKDARITRDWPTGATVVVVERVPWGLWQVNNQSFVIDDEGVVLDVPAPAGSPAIVQVDAQAVPKPGDVVDASAIAVARQLVTTAERTVGRRLVRLEYSQASGLTAVLAADAERPEARVIFGDAQGYEYKVATLFAVLQREEEQGRVVRHVDLRFGDRVSVQTEAPAPREEAQP